MAQILFAIVGAIVLRANIVVAAATTFISNPLTLPALYFWSYRIGTLLLGHAESSRQLEAVADAAEAAEHALEVASWWSALLGWLASVGPSLALGVVTVACLAAAVAYALVYAIWGLWLRLTGSGPA